MDQPQIPVFDLRLEQEDLDAVADVVRSGWLTMGPRTEEPRSSPRSSATSSGATR